jgi:VanZ family protein
LRRGTNGSWANAAFPLAVLFTSLYGISDEIHQAFVPFRDSNWLDWVADTIGAAVGAAVMSRLDHLWPVSSASTVGSRR